MLANWGYHSLPALQQRNCSSCLTSVIFFKLLIMEALRVTNMKPQCTENLMILTDNQYECNNFLMAKHTCKQQVPWAWVITACEVKTTGEISIHINLIKRHNSAMPSPTWLYFLRGFHGSWWHPDACPAPRGDWGAPPRPSLHLDALPRRNQNSWCRSSPLAHLHLSAPKKAHFAGRAAPSGRPAASLLCARELSKDRQIKE